MIEVKPYRLRWRPCIMCGETKAPEDYYWYPYTTNQGKPSLRRESRCLTCARSRRIAKWGETRDREIAGMRAWRERNADAIRDYSAEYRTSEHGRARRAKSQSARYARQKAGLNGPESPEILALYQEARDTERKLAACVECDDPLELRMHVDHIVPLSKGGAHVLANLRVISARENLRKGASV